VVEHGGVQICCSAWADGLSRNLRSRFELAGIVSDPMDTGAACRTYNVLLAEDRRVAAALLPLC
jgi:uncharacterized protein